MLNDIGDVMRRCYQKGWITTRDGNVSLRIENSLYITPSGCDKSLILPKHLVKCEIKNEELIIPKAVIPSGELEMHWLLQKKWRIEPRAVVHVHATNIVAAMFAGWDIQNISLQFPEIYRYSRVGPSVAMLPAVSKELAVATANCLDLLPSGKTGFDIVGQANHGVCSIGPDPWSAYEHIERLEHICEIVLKSGLKASDLKY